MITNAEMKCSRILNLGPWKAMASSIVRDGSSFWSVVTRNLKQQPNPRQYIPRNSKIIESISSLLLWLRIMLLKNYQHDIPIVCSRYRVSNSGWKSERLIDARTAVTRSLWCASNTGCRRISRVSQKLRSEHQKSISTASSFWSFVPFGFPIADDRWIILSSYDNCLIF